MSETDEIPTKCDNCNNENIVFVTVSYQETNRNIDAYVCPRCDIIVPIHDLLWLIGLGIVVGYDHVTEGR